MVTLKKAKAEAEAEGTIVDTKAALEWLFDLQAARVEKLEAAEATYNPEIRKEIKLLADLSGQLSEFYFAIGIRKKAPRTTTVKNEGATTVIESPGRTQVILSMQEKAQLQEARKALHALIEAEHKAKAEEDKAQKIIH